MGQTKLTLTVWVDDSEDICSQTYVEIHRQPINEETGEVGEETPVYANNQLHAGGIDWAAVFTGIEIGVNPDYRGEGSPTVYDRIVGSLWRYCRGE